MMYFMNGKFIVDFNMIEKFITNVYESGSGFLTEISPYAMIGIGGFMVGICWHAFMCWKEKREHKRIEQEYEASNV